MVPAREKRPAERVGSTCWHRQSSSSSPPSPLSTSSLDFPSCQSQAGGEARKHDSSAAPTEPDTAAQPRALLHHRHEWLRAEGSVHGPGLSSCSPQPHPSPEAAPWCCGCAERALPQAVREPGGQCSAEGTGSCCLLGTTAPQEPGLALNPAGPAHPIRLSRRLLLPQHTERDLGAAAGGRGSKTCHDEAQLPQGRRKSRRGPRGQTHLSSHLICTQPGLRRKDQGWNHFSTVCRLEHSTSSHKCSTCSLRRGGGGTLLG